MLRERSKAGTQAVVLPEPWCSAAVVAAEIPELTVTESRRAAHPRTPFLAPG
jgi:hypothetical protein